MRTEMPCLYVYKKKTERDEGVMIALILRFLIFINMGVQRALDSYQGNEVKSERSSGGMEEKSNLGTGFVSMMRQHSDRCREINCEVAPGLHGPALESAASPRDLAPYQIGKH